MTQPAVDPMLLDRLHDAVVKRRRLPQSTYRLQFHAGFTFRDASAIVPYLAELGITHCYASPYLKARPGSTHGYDVIDHRSLNPEIGTDADYRQFLAVLKQHGMGHILDTVPNHVGVGTNENAWWNDVLESGPASKHAAFFDISWHGSPRPELQNKVLLPLLGKPYAQALEAGELRLIFEHGTFFISYYERRFPIAPGSYCRILAHRLDELENTLRSDANALHGYRDLLTLADDLPEQCEEGSPHPRQPTQDIILLKQRLAALADQSLPVRHFIAQTLEQFNGVKGDSASFDLLDDLIRCQNYRLAYWRVAPDEINYRRFFDINDLAAISMERPEVFQATHELIRQWLASGNLQGLRIDHPDGLYDPKQYFLRLQTAYLMAVAAAEQLRLSEDQASSIAAELFKEGPAGWPLYVTVEKILALGEPLPSDWAVHGTSGYDFLDMLNGLYVDSKQEPAFTRIYQQFFPAAPDFADLVYQKKRLILRIALASELHMLAHRLDRLAQADRRFRDFTQNGLREALGEVIACFPVYRSYVSAEGVRDDDRKYVNQAIEQAIARNSSIEPSIFHFIRDMVLLAPSRFFNDRDREHQLQFAARFQQLTAPVTAKGIEDTTFYIYNRLVSLNEVGGEPSHFGIAPAALHAYLADRQTKWPYALSPLSTHDTKRSEDVRARINVLSEMPDEWQKHVTHWRQINEDYHKKAAPDANDEYLLYQTLIGAWPIEGIDMERDSFVQRIQDYMEKAIREAKVHTSWTNQNAEYENAVREFVAAILAKDSPFLESFIPFQSRLNVAALLNSLSQTLIRLTAPGVPDTYQGTELLDYSLVDPDNRRPVDFERRRQLLCELKEQFVAATDRAAFLRAMFQSNDASRPKLLITWLALQQRKEKPLLFTEGEYIPLTAQGARARHIFAFARRRGDDVAISIAPRLCDTLIRDVIPMTPATIWQDTHVVVPNDLMNRKLVDVFTGQSMNVSTDTGIPVALVLQAFPAALLE